MYSHVKQLFIVKLGFKYSLNEHTFEYEYNPDAKLVHHTLGTPCFKDYQNTDYSQEWWDCYKRMIYPLKGNNKDSEL